MKPVYQTLFGSSSAPAPERGNCYPACFASILGVPLDEVPHFYGNDEPLDVQNVNVQRWLRSQGWVSINYEWPFNEHMLALLRESYAIFSGESPRFPGVNHAVVGRVRAGGWRLEHDPHPSGDGLVGDPNYVEILARLPFVGELVPYSPMSAIPEAA